MLDFPIYLGHRLLTAHGQDGVTKADQYSDQAHCVRQVRVTQPSQRVFGKGQMTKARPGGKMRPSHPECVAGPDNHQHDHDGSHVHDAQGFLAGLRDAFDVLPPEVDGDEASKEGGRQVHGQAHRNVRILQELVQKPHQIEARGDAADRSGEDVVKHEGRNGELGQCRAHCFLDHTVHAAAHKHAAALDVKRAYGVSEAHDGQNEPRSRFAHEVFRNGAGIKRRRAHVVENYRCGPPKRDKRKHGGSGNQHAWQAAFSGVGRSICGNEVSH